MEEARLGLRGHAPAARGHAIDRREVFVLAAAVPTAGAGQIERPGVVHREAAGGRHADAGCAAHRRVVALAGDVHGGGESRGKRDLRPHLRRREDGGEPEQRDERAPDRPRGHGADHSLGRRTHQQVYATEGGFGT